MADEITVLPALSDSDLGRILTGVPIADLDRDLGAEQINAIKNWIVRLGSAIGLSDGSDAESIFARIIALEAGGGALIGFTEDITPAQITGALNDYGPTGYATANVYRLDLDANRSLSGMLGGADGAFRILINTSAFVLQLKHASTNSAAANRYLCMNGQDANVPGGSSALCLYDITTQRWRVLTATDAAGLYFIPNGDIAATNVQAAIQEVRDDTDTKLALKASISYVDSLVQGLSPKKSVRVATAGAALTLATAYENGDTIDGVVLATGDRILIKDQAAPAENGIYTVNASGAPTRATDMDLAAEVEAGVYCFVEEGTVNANSGWVLSTDGAITLNTTALTFVRLTNFAMATSAEAITGTATDRAVTPAGLKAYVDQVPSNPQGAGYALAAADIGGVTGATGAGAQAFTLPDLSGSLTSGKAMILTIQQTGAATNVTITPGGSSQIDGAGTGVAFVVGAGRKRVSLISWDGLNWYSGA